MTRDLIWKEKDNKGINLVGWSTVTTPKNHGGLGVGDAREPNTALFGKLVWDMLNMLITLISSFHPRGMVQLFGIPF